MSMPRMREMLAGLGASASLAAAGALALLVVSAVIALEGFPGMNPDAGGRRLAVADLTVPTADPDAAAVAPDRLVAAAPEPAAPPPAPAPDAASEVEIPAAPSAPVDTGPDVPPRVPDTGPGDPRLDTGPDSRPRRDVERPPLIPEEPLRDVTVATGGLVGEVGDGLADVVDIVLPGSGRMMRDTTAGLDETLRDTGEAVDHTLDGLLGG